MMVDGGLTLKYKTQTISSQDDALEKLKELISDTVFGTQVVEKI